MSILSRRARVKELSNKAEGIFQYVGTDNVLFRLISTGNELTSDVNHVHAGRGGKRPQDCFPLHKIRIGRNHAFRQCY